MCDTDGTLHILVITKVYQIIDLSLCLIDVQLIIVVNQCHSGAVVTTILQSSKTLDQYGKSLLIPNVSYNSAHIV